MGIQVQVLQVTLAWPGGQPPLHADTANRIVDQVQAMVEEAAGAPVDVQCFYVEESWSDEDIAADAEVATSVRFVSTEWETGGEARWRTDERP